MVREFVSRLPYSGSLGDTGTAIGQRNPAKVDDENFTEILPIPGETCALGTENPTSACASCGETDVGMG
jgi:hypothetical protein